MTNPQAIAKSWPTPDGQVTFTMRPYVTIRHNILNDEFEEIVPQGKWKEAHVTFLAFESDVVSVEFAEELTAQRQGLKAYWECRTGELVEDWKLFISLIGREAYEDFWLAHTATRDKAIELPAPENEEAKKNAPKRSRNARANTPVSTAREG